MTDEEMASEYADKQEETIPPFSEEGGYCWNQITEAFLAGLKAGRPQWHNLRENPNDLPEKMGLGSREVYVAYKDGVTDFAYYRFDKNIWERSEDDEQAVGVIAWCELPTFDKE